MKIIVSKKSNKCDLNLVPEENFVTGINTFKQIFNDVTSHEEDTLTFASVHLCSWEQ